MFSLNSKECGKIEFIKTQKNTSIELKRREIYKAEMWGALKLPLPREEAATELTSCGL